MIPADLLTRSTGSRFPLRLRSFIKILCTYQRQIEFRIRIVYRLLNTMHRFSLLSLQIYFLRILCHCISPIRKPVYLSSICYVIFIGIFTQITCAPDRILRYALKIAGLPARRCASYARKAKLFRLENNFREYFPNYCFLTEKAL